MPVVTIGNNTGDDFSGTEDTELTEGSPTSNFNANTSWEVGKYTGGDWRMSLIRFTGLSSISGPVTVASATFNMWLADVNGANQTVAARRLLRNWVNAQATWNIYSTGNSWTTAGGLSNGNDRVTTASGTSGTVGTSGAYKTISGLASDTEGFINGSLSNYGWHLERADAQNDAQYMVFRASEGTDGERPYLEVDYSSGAGTGLPRNLYRLTAVNRAANF